MRLSQPDVDVFYRLWFSVLAYVGLRNPTILNAVKTPEELRGMRFDKLAPLRAQVYQQPDIFSSYVVDNPDRFSVDELAIVAEWRHFVKDDFVLLRQLKSYAIFLDSADPPKAFGVLALVSAFEELLELPAMINAVLLPFKGQIIYDGLFNYQPLTFGPSVRARFNQSYQQAKSLTGIITSLPYAPQKTANADEEMLRFYLKSAANREQYWDEIDSLLYRNPALRPVYHQETAKRNVRIFKKLLREQEVAPAWFAALDNLFIASGKTRDDVLQSIAWLLPAEKRDYVYLFQWKP